MIEFRVDFNSRRGDGMLKASLRRASGPVVRGDKVLATDRAEDMRYVAIVDTIDEVSGRVWLDVQWDAAVPQRVDIFNSAPQFWIGQATTEAAATRQPEMADC